MQNLINLKNKIILVTGASSGIGRETAILLSNLGANLILTGRNRAQLDSTLEKLEGTDHYGEIFDFNDCSNINTFIKNILNRTGKLDGLVHCAGIQISEPLRFIEEKSIDLTFQTNIKSTILFIQATRKHQALNNPSSIVLISSITGLMGEPGMSVYAASKAAIIAVTKSLASELARDGIRINCIAPAIVKTEMTKKMFSAMGKEQLKTLENRHLLGFGETIDIANINAFLLSDASRWTTGSCFVIDGGYSLSR